MIIIDVVDFDIYGFVRQYSISFWLYGGKIKGRSNLTFLNIICFIWHSGWIEMFVPSHLCMSTSSSQRTGLSWQLFQQSVGRYGAATSNSLWTAAHVLQRSPAPTVPSSCHEIIIRFMRSGIRMCAVPSLRKTRCGSSRPKVLRSSGGVTLSWGKPFMSSARSPKLFSASMRKLSLKNVDE